MKSRLKKCLVTLFVVAIACTQILTTAAIDDKETIFSGYVTTDEMTDKTDTVQANYQEADTSDVDIVYSEDFIQSVEWTDQEDGEALLSLYYSAEFDDVDTGSRVLYVMTNCLAHNFSQLKAVANIIDLLMYYDYVDVIVLASVDSQNSSTVEDGSAGAIKAFSVYYGDFVDDDGVGIRTSGGYKWVTTTSGSTGMVTYSDTSSIIRALGNVTQRVLATYRHSGIHEFGYVDGDEEDTGGTITGLYDSTGNWTSSSALASLAAFGNNRHRGAYMFLIFLQDYYELIEDKIGDFDHVVEGIYLSFDGFVGPYRMGAAASIDSITYDGLYPYIEENLGIDLLTTITSFSVLESTVPNALEILLPRTPPLKPLALAMGIQRRKATKNLMQSEECDII